MAQITESTINYIHKYTGEGRSFPITINELDQLACAWEELQVLKARMSWLEDNAKEEFLHPERVVGEYPDMRTQWVLPTLICSGPVGGTMTLAESIDAARACSDNIDVRGYTVNRFNPAEGSAATAAQMLTVMALREQQKAENENSEQS